MKKRLITSALPYVNNIPHLGNIIQVLSADVFARFCRMRGYETLYVCGTDEYGTATETRAMEEGVSPRELCDRYFVVHRDIYKWFNIAFDHFGRTSRPVQTEIVQDIFKKVHANGFITEHEIEQLYSEKSQMFLADRYVRGTCPNCGYPDARGDQCENCGTLLEPTELKDPKSVVDGTTPVLRKTTHLYLNLPALKDRLEAWLKPASVSGKWAKNAVNMSQGWIRDGLKERGITRDLKWGIPVPLKGYENKVFYVWFDAPIGYVSITADLTKDWEKWWKRPDEVELFQFVGKDNIPFHTVIFPSTQIATGENWTMLHHMSSTEYLNYESGKFSKSKGIGVFGNDVMDTGIPVDVWRFYIFYNRPETSDYTFTWKDFQEKVNKELIGNFANLVNRTLSLWQRYFGLELPVPETGNEASASLWKELRTMEAKAAEFLEWADLRDGLRTALEISAFGNRIMQAAAPWNLFKTDPTETRRVLADLLYLIRDLSILMRPYIPGSAEKVASFLGIEAEAMVWSNLGKPGPLAGETSMKAPELLFKQLENDLIETLRLRFSGSQSERLARENEAKPETPQKETDEVRFSREVELRVAKIVNIARHPDAEKLYIETLDDGSSEPRTIVSGLVPYYREEELLGKNIILVANLKPAKLRGVESRGMLLAASNNDGERKVEVLFAPDAKPGDQVRADGSEAAGSLSQITVDQFFDIPIKAINNEVRCGKSRLYVGDYALGTHTIKDGEIG